MSRNLSFLLIAISLVVYIYYSEELVNQKEQEIQLASEQIYDIKKSGALLSFKGRDFSFSKKGDRFFSKDKMPIDQLKVKKFFIDLLNIKVVRVLNNNELKEIDTKLLANSDAPKLSFRFENSSLEMTLGNKTQFSKNFYVKITKNNSKNEKWAIASYRAPYSAQLNSKDAHRSEVPYRNALSLFGVKKENLLNLKVFQSFKSIDSYEVRSKRNKKYRIDFTQLKTVPRAPSGIEELSSRIENHREALTGLEALEIYREGELEDLIGELLVNGQSIKFFSKRDNSRGYFLKNQNYIYKLSSQSFRILFEPQQYFWKKELDLVGSKDFEVYDLSDELVLKSDLSAMNTWTQVLSSKAKWLSKPGNNSFKFDYVLKAGGSTYHVKNVDSGTEVLDLSKQVIFHFLEKIK